MVVNDIRNILRDKLEEDPEAPMLEIIGASFIADEDSIFGTPNKEYIKKEIAWYDSQSRNVYDMENPPKIWVDIADSRGLINSNYGWCIYSTTNHNQYYSVLDELKTKISSRRGTMIYNRPSMHIEATAGGKNDFMCTNAVNYMVHEGKLDCIVQMRSNDAVFGYKNDFAFQKHVLDKLSYDLEVDVGTIHWQVANLHVYPRHYYLVKGE